MTHAIYSGFARICTLTLAVAMTASLFFGGFACA